MKKRALAVALCVCTVFSMAACSKSKSKEGTEGKLVLGEYKGYTVGESVTQVSDEDVQKYIDAILSIYKTTETVTEGVTAASDSANVTYHQFVNGAETGDFQTAEDGTSLGITEQVTLSADSFVVAGFTDALTGKNIGETVEMDLQFPEDYADAELAGQPVHYQAVVNSVSKTVTPEFSDAFVSEHYAFAGCTTAAEFTEFIKQEIYYININSIIWDDILEAQKVESYPSDELKKYVDVSYRQIENMITAYGYSMDAYYQTIGKTEEELMKELEEDCKPIVKEKMFVRMVAQKEKIEYSEDAACKYAAISGYSSVDEFKQYLEEYGEELEYSVLSYQVQNFICDSVKVVSDEETTADEQENNVSGAAEDAGAEEGADAGEGTNEGADAGEDANNDEQAAAVSEAGEETSEQEQAADGENVE